MPRRIASAVFVALVLAVAIHTDWHFARSTHHRLSLGLWWHWLLAIPAFAFVAVYVARVWSTQLWRASVAILGTAVVIAGLLEPLWEYAAGGAPFEWAFGVQRNIAFASFVGPGVLTYVALLAWLQRAKHLTAAG